MAGRKSKKELRDEHLKENYSEFSDKMLELADQLNDEEITTYFYQLKAKELAYELIDPIVQREVEVQKNLIKARNSRKKKN